MKNKIKESGFSETTFSVSTLNTSLNLSGKNPMEILFLLEQLSRYPLIKKILDNDCD